MSLADAKTYSEVIEIWVKIAAIVLGGAWAVYGFVVFRQRLAATTALRKSESEAASLELASKRRAVLDIAITHECRPAHASDGYILILQVVISNGGVAPARIEFENEKAPLRVQRVDFDADGTMRFPEPPVFLPVPNASDPTKPARSRVIRAGGTSRLSSVVRVGHPGVYAVSFRVPMDATNRQAMIEAGSDPARKHAWSALTFACVGFSPANPKVPTA